NLDSPLRGNRCSTVSASGIRFGSLTSPVSISSPLLDPIRRYMNGASKVAHRFSRRMNVWGSYACTPKGGCGLALQSFAPSFQWTSNEPVATAQADKDVAISGTANKGESRILMAMSRRVIVVRVYPSLQVIELRPLLPNLQGCRNIPISLIDPEPGF